MKGFKSQKAGVSRIWERIQGLGEAEKPRRNVKTKQLLMFPSAHGEPTNVGGLYGFLCGGAMRVPGVMMTSPVDLRQISYTRSGSRRM